MVATEAVSEIERMAQILSMGDLDCYVERTPGIAGMDKLHVVLGTDARKRDYVLQLFFIDDVVEAAGIDVEDDGYDCVVLQFFIQLPYEIEGDNELEALRIANLLNRALPLGHVSVAEPERAFCLSYQLALEDRDIAPDLLAEVVSLLGFALATYGPTLEGAARGAINFAGIVETFRSIGLDPTAAGDPPATAPARTDDP